MRTIVEVFIYEGTSERQSEDGMELRDKFIWLQEVSEIYAQESSKTSWGPNTVA